MSSFNFDSNAFKREIGKQVESAMKDITGDLNREMSAMVQQYQGRPLDEIKVALQRLYAKRDGHISDPELTEYAEAVQAGTTITFKADKVRW